MENEAETPNELQIVEKFGESDASNDSTTNNSESQSGSKKRKIVKERSVAWHHFTKFIDAEGVKKAKCKYCSEEYVADTKNSGTSNLLLHISKYPSNPNKAKTSQTTLVFQHKGQTDLKKHKKCGGVDPKTELDKYLGEDIEEDHKKFNILGWWKLNSPRFLTFAEMARDVLAIPISSIASESAFSVGGHILDPFRSLLTPRLVQALVFVQDWLQNESTSPVKIEEDLDNLEQLEAQSLALSTYSNFPFVVQAQIFNLLSHSPTENLRLRATLGLVVSCVDCYVNSIYAASQRLELGTLLCNMLKNSVYLATVGDFSNLIVVCLFQEEAVELF
ncbi:uncharacterized protein [Nicotiana tomentosiformis]|uniref:uncharacterized protein n=1 Tax=Nicotiana tomentosiformis TaxID=4098 RepID=UPI00388C9630